jgi:hypothetical protein
VKLRFKKRIKIKDELIDVKKISATYEEPTGEFKYFKIEYGEVAEEIAESIGAGRRELIAVKQEVGGLREDTSQGFVAVKEEIGRLREDTSQGFVAVKEELHGFREESKANFETLGNKMDSNFENLGTKMDNNFNTLDGKYDVVSTELKAMNKNIAKLIEYIGALVEDYIKTKKAKK